MKIIGKIFCLVSMIVVLLNAAPQPGDIYKEYTWYNRDGDADYAIRVGANNAETSTETQTLQGHHWITIAYNPGWDIDLTNAIRAEVVVEKILCHDGSFGLGIMFNGFEWIRFSESDSIPSPQKNYQHHIYPIVEIPLEHLKNDNQNRFKFCIRKEQGWNWPQNLINGVHLRIFYDKDSVEYPTGLFLNPLPGDTLDESVKIELEATSLNGYIARVDFLGLYTDINWEGDGIYRQWHYHYYHGVMKHYIGTITNYWSRDSTTVFNKEWNTSWIPDQDQPMELSARIVDNNDMIYFCEPVTGLNLKRSEFSVELSPPYDIPMVWVTRNGERSEKVDITGDLSKAVAYKLCWVSWSPGYMNGVYVNGRKVFSKEGPHYAYYAHNLTLSDPSVLNAGTNIIKTGATGAVNGQTVHGMEVQWPGIQMLVKYSNNTSITEKITNKPLNSLFYNYPNPFNSQTRFQYTILEPNQVNLSIYNISGRKIAELVNKFQGSGTFQIQWVAKDCYGKPLSSGIYFAVLKTINQTNAIKIVLLK